MEPKQDKTVMPWILANAYGEEPDALIALVRVCGGALQVTGGSTRKARESVRMRECANAQVGCDTDGFALLLAAESQHYIELRTK